jgi:hypothetical protein
MTPDVRGGTGGGVMWFSSDHRGVRILVRGEFVAPRQWLIHATVAGGSGTDKASRAASRRRTLNELWQGIAVENRVGRHLGAVAVRVVVEGDPDIAELFAKTERPEQARTSTLETVPAAPAVARVVSSR